MARRAKQTEPSEPEREAGVAVEDPAPSGDPPPAVEARPALPPPPPRIPPEAPPRTPTGPGFGQRVGRFFRFLFRLVILLILLTVLSVALYFAVPLFYDTFVRPVERNSVQVQQLQSRQEQTEQQLADLQAKLENLETVQNDQDGSLTEFDQRLRDIETEIAARTDSLAALEEMQAEFQQQNKGSTAELQRQLERLKAMELLSRARLFMYQSNFGLARQDVQLARDVLAAIEPGDSVSEVETLNAVVLRLDMTLSNLPNFPVAASDDLDIAWQILLTGLPDGTPTAISTPTSSAGGGTITATLPVTATPLATLQPSATP